MTYQTPRAQQGRRCFLQLQGGSHQPAGVGLPRPHPGRTAEQGHEPAAPSAALPGGAHRSSPLGRTPNPFPGSLSAVGRGSEGRAAAAPDLQSTAGPGGPAPSSRAGATRGKPSTSPAVSCYPGTTAGHVGAPRTDGAALPGIGMAALSGHPGMATSHEGAPRADAAALPGSSMAAPPALAAAARAGAQPGTAQGSPSPPVLTLNLCPAKQ